MVIQVELPVLSILPVLSSCQSSQSRFTFLRYTTFLQVTFTFTFYILRYILHLHLHFTFLLHLLSFTFLFQPYVTVVTVTFYMIFMSTLSSCVVDRWLQGYSSVDLQVEFASSYILHSSHVHRFSSYIVHCTFAVHRIFSSSFCTLHVHCITTFYILHTYMHATSLPRTPFCSTFHVFRTFIFLPFSSYIAFIFFFILHFARSVDLILQVDLFTFCRFFCTCRTLHFYILPLHFAFALQFMHFHLSIVFVHAVLFAGFCILHFAYHFLDKSFHSSIHFTLPLSSCHIILH